MKMNKGRRRNLKVGAVLVGIGVGVLFIAAASDAQQGMQHGMQHGQGGLQQKMEEGKQPAEGLNMIHSTQLPAAQKMLERAILHLEAGHQQEALKELRQAQGSLEAVRQALGKHIEPPIANGRCPIMGSPISASKVPAHLTRTYEGRKVAFCCAGCPEAWDQLDNAQKTAKLASAIAGPQLGPIQPRRMPAAPQPAPVQPRRTPAASQPHRH
jgi:hypothetical protein